MHLQFTMSYLRLGSTSTGHARHVKTRNDNGLRIRIFSQKLSFFVGKKMFQRQIQEEQYTIPIRHMTNSSDFVWFQRSCGSMKSVSSFSSIDITDEQINIEGFSHTIRNLRRKLLWGWCSNLFVKHYLSTSKVCIRVCLC